MGDQVTGMPPLPPAPRKTRRWPWIVGIVVALFVGIGIGAASKNEQPVAQPPADVTTSSPPAVAQPSVTPVTPESPVAQPSEAPVSQEAAACKLTKRALGLPPYSSRWDGVVSDAQDAAVSDAAYNLLVKAGDELFDHTNADYDKLATQDLRDFVTKYC